jgi:hypothetical protein
MSYAFVLCGSLVLMVLIICATILAYPIAEQFAREFREKLHRDWSE